MSGLAHWSFTIGYAAYWLGSVALIASWAIYKTLADKGDAVAAVGLDFVAFNARIAFAGPLVVMLLLPLIKAALK